MPSPGRFYASVITLEGGSLVQPNVRQMRILTADMVFKLSIPRAARQTYIREGLSLVPRPTHALHLATWQTMMHLS